MPDFYIAVWQEMLLKPAQKFRYTQRHCFFLFRICIVVVGKAYTMVCNAADAVFCDGCFMRISLQLLTLWVYLLSINGFFTN